MTEANTPKQGRARKVNERNFYLMCQYLIKKDIFPAPYSNEDEISSELKFLRSAQSEQTSKEYIQRVIDAENMEMTWAQECIDTQRFVLMFKDQKTSEEIITKNKATIESAHKDYIELCEDDMWVLHRIVIELDDKLYAAMNSWIKQTRHRKKESSRQVTLSEEAKQALSFLKSYMKAADYNETLIQIKKKIKSKQPFIMVTL